MQSKFAAVTGCGSLTTSISTKKSDMNAKVTAHQEKILLHCNASLVYNNYWRLLVYNNNTCKLILCTLYTHKLTDHHSSMMNLTSRIAVRIQHLPQDIDWNDSTPQCSVDSLTIDHFMASESAGEDFRARAIQYTARYLVTEFSAFGHLKKYLSEHHLVNPVTKAEYVPMKVLFKDEKYTSETVDILSTLMKDAELKGSNQVSIILNQFKTTHTHRQSSPGCALSRK